MDLDFPCVEVLQSSRMFMSIQADSVAHQMCQKIPKMLDVCFWVRQGSLNASTPLN